MVAVWGHDVHHPVVASTPKMGKHRARMDKQESTSTAGVLLQPDTAAAGDQLRRCPSGLVSNMAGPLT